MSAVALSAASLSVAHQQFVDALPAMNETIRYNFRGWPRRRRAEAIDAARAACWLAWHGLLARGKDPLVVGVTAIAFNASRYVKNERQFGCGTSGPGGRDIFHHKAQADCGFKIISLDREVGPDRGAASDAWREWLAEDNSVSPADEAAFRVDFEDWLASLPGRGVAGHGRGDRRGGPDGRRQLGSDQPVAQGAGRKLEPVPGRGGSGGPGPRLSRVPAALGPAQGDRWPERPLRPARRLSHRGWALTRGGGRSGSGGVDHGTR
jgi:hypothetical protein